MPRLVKRYFLLLWQQRTMATLGLLTATITAIAGISLLAVSGWFISATAVAGLSIIGAQSFNYFAPGALVRGLSITRTVGRYAERITTHEATLRVISHLRAELFGELASSSWHEQPLNTHEASSRLLEDIKHAESLYLSALVPSFVMLLCALLYLVTLAFFLPQTALWFTPIILLAVFFMPWLYMRQVLKPQDQLHQQRNQLWNSASSLFSNIRTLTLYQRLTHQTQQLLETAAITNAIELQANRAKQRTLALSQLLLALQIPIILWHGLSALSAGYLSGEMLFMLLLLTLGTQEVILSSIHTLANFGLGYTALQRIELKQPTSKQRDTRQITQQNYCAIRVNQLTYAYPQRSAATINNMSADFSAPHWYWITAPSGQGKTTFLQLLAGYLQPQTGSISITVPDPTKQPMAFMPQKIDLLRGTLRYNISLHQAHSDEAIMDALKLVELHAWFETLPDGLDSWLGDGERMLSGGELKRLGLARLLLQPAPILLLDEPTAGIDHPRATRILQRLHTQWADKLVIINSHDLSLASESVFNDSFSTLQLSQGALESRPF